MGGVGDVITGRVEQGEVEPGAQTSFLPTHTTSKPCCGKVVTVELHHKSVPMAGPGDNVGLNMKGLDKINMPRCGDVMISSSDTSILANQSFTAQVQVLDHPGELKKGYSPIAFIRTGRSSCKIADIVWKIGKTTGGQKAPNPLFLKANEMGEVKFEPQQPSSLTSSSLARVLGVSPSWRVLPLSCSVRSSTSSSSLKRSKEYLSGELKLAI